MEKFRKMYKQTLDVLYEDYLDSSLKSRYFDEFYLNSPISSKMHYIRKKYVFEANI